MSLPLHLDDWPPAPIRTARLLLRAPEARDRDTFLDLGADDEVNHHLGGGRERAELDAAMPAVPADRPGQFVVEHEGRFVGWMGVGRRDPERPGRLSPGGTQVANLASLRLAERLGFAELDRFEEFGAEQWFGVRRPG